MVRLVFLLAVQVSGVAHSPVCTQALEQEFGAVSAEVCLAEEDMKRASAAREDSSERSRQFASAAEHYRKAAGLSTKSTVRVAVLEALAAVYEERLQAFDDADLVLRQLIAAAPADLKHVFRLARLQENRGWIDAAEALLVETRRQHSETLEPYKVLAQFYARRVAAMSLETARAVAPTPPAQRDEQGVYRTGGSLAPPRRVGTPLYPPEAKAAGIEGAVIAEIVVNEQGSVTDAKVLRSLPLLDDAALAAVRTWQYEPTLVNGQPVPVRMTVTVNFTTR